MAPWRLRSALNWVNLSTPLGLAVAAVGRATVHRGPRGLLVAGGYRLPVPANPAFTVGDVVLARAPAEAIGRRSRLLTHEERHAWQYAACLGLPFLPLYALAACWSWLRGGDPAAHNPFERLAGLADGGYPTLSAGRRRRPSRRRRRHRRPTR